MPFEIIRNDILNMRIDAIVNSTSPEPFIFGGLDLLMHKQAGPFLLEERKQHGILNLAEPIITKGYNLKAKQVIHVVGPIYEDGKQNEASKLRDTYLSVLELAHESKINSIAFPLISSGTYGYPRKKALSIALKVIKTFLDKHDMQIYLVVYDDESYEASIEQVKYVKSYMSIDSMTDISEKVSYSRATSPRKRSLKDILEDIDLTFQESLFEHIDRKGLDDVHVYKHANIDRKLFSKIRSNKYYQPSKATALAFAISLELNLDEANDFLAKAGYTISKSLISDLIVEYHIENGKYNIYDINLALFENGQSSIGSMA